MNNIYLIYFLLFVAVNSEIEQDQIEIERTNKCKIKVGATNEDVKMLNERQIPTSHTGLCLLTCLYEYSGIIQNGKFQIEVFIESVRSGDGSVGQIANNFLDKIINDCKGVSNADKCILSRDIIMCVAESTVRHSQEDEKVRLSKEPENVARILEKEL